MTDQLDRTTGLHGGDRFDEMMARLGDLDPLLRAEAVANEQAGA